MARLLLNLILFGTILVPALFASGGTMRSASRKTFVLSFCLVALYAYVLVAVGGQLLS